MAKINTRVVDPKEEFIMALVRREAARAWIEEAEELFNTERTDEHFADLRKARIVLKDADQAVKNAAINILEVVHCLTKDEK